MGGRLADFLPAKGVPAEKKAATAVKMHGRASLPKPIPLPSGRGGRRPGERASALSDNKKIFSKKIISG